MKEVTKEKVQKYIVYEALDGTQFHDMAECEKYEQSAKGVIKKKIAKLIAGKGNEWDLLAGDECHEIIGIKMQSEKDVDTVKQFFLMECSWYQDKPGAVENIFNVMDTAFEKKDIVLFGINCDGEYYWINSRQNIVNNLLNLDKKEEKEDVR